MSDHENNGNPEALDWISANTGLDLVSRGQLDNRDEFTGARVARVIERLLDQLAERGRAAYDGEDTFLRRAIACYGEGDDESAVDNASRAAAMGNGVLFSGFDDPDRSVPLRDALSEARAARASDLAS
ncbi:MULTISPECIES: hypothetical protein [Paraburkholderia]|uniref:hypothetical protein n=1 Tax=Paraburkholderia TaxID=1822464 RepID=UPI00225B9B13|nr:MULTISPECIES: hypothetical protein [Paraburkholderia]MCX4175669.1 hypothetical protein [Paraburkholderia madseniana]MDQ6463664.1 hypothetical protein [Paraburkholderia madseniana]